MLILQNITYCHPNKDSLFEDLSLNISNFQAAGTARVYQLTSANKINHLADKTVSADTLSDTLPAQSITLYLLPKAS